MLRGGVGRDPPGGLRSYFQELYTAFNRRDLDALIGRLSDDVDWPNAWEGGRLRGPAAVREYWSRQWAELDPHVEPASVAPRPDGRIEVRVRQTVRDRTGQLISRDEVLHVYELSGDRVRRMDVEAP